VTVSLASRVVLVVARPGVLGDRVVAGLRAAGARVERSMPPAGRADAEEALAGDPDVVVWADVDPDALVPAPVVGLSEGQWVRRCEDPMTSLVWVVQAAHAHLRARDGRLILVAPSVALEGAAALVPLAAGVEAQRLLLKSVARRWGPDRITVNTVSVPVTALAPALATDAPDAARTAVSLLDDDPLTTATATVAWLASRDADGVTGATIGADSGAVMAP
jgi:NAD(P)-dependent dehydrogenase (short-subunit alcohol dehydrogenase family)